MGDFKPYYPSEWQDDQTMDVLFSPFRDNRDVNPRSWDRKMKFWTEMIYEECRFSKTPIINIKSLPQRFIRNGRTPVCLETVLLELQREGKTQRVNDFRSSAEAGWLSWGVNMFVKRPLTFSFRTARHMLGWTDTAGDLVVTDVLKEQANALMECHSKQQQGEKLELTRDIKDRECLEREAADICQGEESLELLILQLVKDKRVAVHSTGTDRQKRVLRFQGENEKQVKDITELELQIVKLKDTADRLAAQTDQIAEEMERCRKDAKFYLGKGLRNSAKSALRRKKMLENLQKKRQNNLENVENLLQRLNNVESDKMVMDAYADGSKAYINMVRSLGITPENIDNAMDDVQEVFDMQGEIHVCMQQGIQDPDLDTTAADLEAELVDLLEPDPTEEQLKDLNSHFAGLPGPSQDDFPSVPMFDPSTPPKSSAKASLSSSKPRSSQNPMPAS